MIGKILVVGLGQFGMEVARCLAKRGFFVVAVDQEISLVQQISKDVEKAVQLDSINEEALMTLGLEKMNTAICAIGEKYLENSILTTALLKQLGVPTVIARAASPLHARILRLVGAQETLNPEEEMGQRLAVKLSQPGLIEMIPLSKDIAVSEIKCPTLWSDRMLKDLNLRKNFGVTLLSIKKT
jgi:trk system potassium uptake protein TrkA